MVIVTDVVDDRVVEDEVVVEEAVVLVDFDVDLVSVFPQPTHRLLLQSHAKEINAILGFTGSRAVSVESVDVVVGCAEDVEDTVSVELDETVESVVDVVVLDVAEYVRLLEEVLDAVVDTVDVIVLASSAPVPAIYASTWLPERLRSDSEPRTSQNPLRSLPQSSCLCWS